MDTKALTPPLDEPRLILTPEHMAAIGAGARSISPSWGATHDGDPQCASDAAYIGAASGGCSTFDVWDTYTIYLVGPDQFELANIREGGDVIGTFRTVHEAVEAMRAHASCPAPTG